MMKKSGYLSLVLFIVAVFTACSGGGSDSSTPVTPQDGVAYFIDSPVSGLSYKSQSKDGLTTVDGAFEYAPSDTNVTFKAGEITLGTIKVADINADSKLFVQDLLGVERDNITDPAVLKLASFLQSLDTGANTNGITLDANDLENLNETMNVEDINVTRQLSLAGKTLKPELEVIEHLGNTIRLNGIALYNYTPQSNDSNISTLKNIVTNGTLNATDKNDNFLEYSIVSNATNGTVELITDSNSFKYAPNPDFTGTDSFTFKAYDGEKYSGVATVNIIVEDVVLTSNDSIAPTAPTIVSLDAQKNSLTLFWLNATDEITPTNDIRYEIHLSTDVNFTADSTTLKQTLVNTLEADIAGLNADTLYYVKVRALDGADNSATSVESSMQTLSEEVVLVPTTVVKKATELHLENAVEDSDTLVFEDSEKADIPNAGDILVGNAQDAYLKKVVSVDKNDTTTTVEVEDVAITDVVESAKLSSKVVLFGSGDVASTPSNAMRRSVRYTTSNTKESSSTWGSGRFSVTNTQNLSSSSSSPSRSISKSNSGFEVTIVKDDITVIQGETIQIDIEAIMKDAGVDDAWKFKRGAIKFISLTNADSASSNNFSAWYTTSKLGVSEVNGYLKWTPTTKNVSTTPYIARFEVFAEDLECSDTFDACDKGTEIIEAKITVIGDGKVDTGGEITTSFSSDVEFTNDVILDFTPELIIDHEIAGSTLNYAKVALNGKLDFNVLTKFAYTAAAKKTYNSQLVKKSYRSVYVAGVVPIYQEIVFTVDAELEAIAEGSITATSDLQTSFEIEAGMEFDGTNWNPISSNEFTKDYTATIEAAGGVNVKVRLIPNIEVKFYTVASSGLSVEPWLEGNLKASAIATVNTDFTDSDALGLHRVENLDLDVGVEAKVYADLTIWKYNLAHYPSEGNDENGDGKKTIYNPSLSVFSIPSIALEDDGTDVCSQSYILNAIIENPDSLVQNNFVSSSVEWIVFPSTGATITPSGSDNTEATFTFDKQDNYTVYMVGNSEKLGSFFGKQYESFSVDTRNCEIGGESNEDTIAPIFEDGSSLELSVDENLKGFFTLNVSDNISSIEYNFGIDYYLFNIYTNSDGVSFSFKEGKDYESVKSISTVLNATDEAGNQSSINLIINIQNIDDTAPLFTSAATISKDENQKDAGVVQADDESTLTYSITDGDAQSFTIDATTGVMAFLSTPDFETKSGYTFTAIATDALGYESNQSVTINIIDVEEIDNTAPVFTSSATFTAEENQNTISGKLVATDENTITYSIKDGDADDFLVTSNGGSLLFGLGKAPDFETKSSYTFTAVATDESNNSTEQSVTITILNVDDDPFITTWKTNNDGTSGDDQITITADKEHEIYDFNVDWGDGTISSSETSITHTYGTAGTYIVKISGKFPGFSASGDNNKLLSVEAWGDIKWVDMGYMFYRCSNLVINASDLPDLSNVYSMYGMFSQTDNFNSDISDWNTSSVMRMDDMFYNAKKFNQNIDSWDMSNVSLVANMFRGASDFNQSLNSWDTSNFVNTVNMFASATSFNGEIGDWNLSKLTSINSMFENATSFNQNISKWDVSNVNSFANFYGVFKGATAFNQDISSWDMSNALRVEFMFYGATAFNQNINGWDTGNITNFNSMFASATSFNQGISSWDMSNAYSISGMFANATSFNQDISAWNTSNVVVMSSVFENATSFNQNLNTWDMSSVSYAGSMFKNATSFNKDLSAWNMSKVERMSSMFENATSFNQNIGGWNTQSATNIIDMFKGAVSFNQDIGSWNTSKVTYMWNMFDGASSFNQDIGAWDVSSLTNAFEMFKGVSLSTANYDSILLNWSTQELKPDVLFSAGNSMYSTGAAADARQNIISTYGWTITDGGEIMP